MRAEPLELSLAEVPAEPHPVPVRNRARRLVLPRVGLRLYRSAVGVELARSAEHLAPLQKARIPVRVLGDLDVTEPTGRPAPLARPSATEAGDRPRLRRHLLGERPLEGD